MSIRCAGALLLFLAKTTKSKYRVIISYLPEINIYNAKKNETFLLHLFSLGSGNWI